MWHKLIKIIMTPKSIAIVAGALLVLLILILSLPRRSPAPPTPPSPTPLPEITFVPITVAPQQTLYTSPENDFKILYTPHNQLYLITILATPYASVRQKAEDQFTQIIQVEKSDACKLQVLITAPYYIHRQIIPNATSLSFCSPS